METANWRGGNEAAQQATAGLLDAPMGAREAASRSLLDVELGDYENPWIDAVVKSALASYDEQRGMEEKLMRADAARGQKFSGSGYAIRQALFDRGTLQDRTGIESNLRAQGFDRATGLATQDLNREAQTSQFNAGQVNSMTAAERDAQLRSAGLLGDLSNSQSANERADLGLLSDIGAEEREIAAQEAGAEPYLLSLISSLNGAQPYGLFQGETRTGESESTTKSKQYGLGTALDTIGGLAAGLGKAMSGANAIGFKVPSDRRLKTDIETVGRDGAGRRVVSFRYKGEPPHVRRVGHIAQEVEKTNPEAVVKGPGGFRMIDYGLLSEGV